MRDWFLTRSNDSPPRNPKMAAELALVRLNDDLRRLSRKREGILDERFFRNKCGFGFGGVLLLMGLVAVSSGGLVGGLGLLVVGGLPVIYAVVQNSKRRIA